MVRIGRPSVPIRLLLTDVEFVTFPEGFRRKNPYRTENKCQTFLGFSESSFAFLPNREHSTIGPIFMPIIKMALPFYAVDTFNLIAGALQRRQQRFVEAWAELHQEEILSCPENFSPLSRRFIPSRSVAFARRPCPGRLRSGALRAGRLDGRIQATYFRDRTLLEDWGRLQSGYSPLPIDPLR